MSNQIKKPTPKTYDAGDIVDIIELAVNDVKWLNMGISHLKAEFYKAKDLIQEQYKVHDCYFDKLAEFFDMYQYLADDRLGEQERIAEKYKDEYAAVKEGQVWLRPTPPSDLHGNHATQKPPQQRD